jgi:serine/threonine protein kinase
MLESVNIFPGGAGMATLSPVELLAWLGQNQFLTPAQIDALRAPLPDLAALVKDLVRREWLTPFQANQIAQGKHEELLLDDYQIRERIGDGAMGHVYKAWSLRLQRVVAIKTIHQDRINSTTAMERFRREVQAAAQLAHPNICLVRDAGEENQRPYLVMDYIEGFNLSSRVKQRGPMPIPEAAEYIRQAALGLQHAFERGIVHRDIKPANLMVTKGKINAEPVLKILDFGLARYESEAESTSRLTQVGNLLGTVDYVAPEQAQNARGADIRADIYSLGCTLFYLLTAKPPFEGDSVLEKIGPRLTGEAPWVRTQNANVPPGLEEIVRTMMARLPDDRYQTPIEVAQALAPYAAEMTLPTSSAPGVVMAMPVSASAVQSDVPMAAPIVAQSVPSEPTVKSNSAAQSERKALSQSKMPLGWFALAGLGIVLMAGLCMAGCFSFLTGGKQAKTPTLLITAAKLSAPSQTVHPGDTKRVIVTIRRVHFEGPVTVSLQDLPKDVVGGDSKIIPPTADSTEVSLTVSYGAEPIATQIRVVAEGDVEGAVGERILPFTIVEEKKKSKK